MTGDYFHIAGYYFNLVLGNFHLREGISSPGITPHIVGITRSVVKSIYLRYKEKTGKMVYAFFSDGNTDVKPIVYRLTGGAP